MTKNSQPLCPYQGFGLGLRPKHYPDVLKGGASKASWFEVVTENFLGNGGRPLSILEKIRSNFPIAFHCVSGSLGSTDELNLPYFKRLKSRIDRFEPFIVSDHCCWTRIGGQNFHDLLPLPFTREAIEHISSQISQVQEILGQRILIENVSSYLSFKEDEMKEWEFLSEILKSSGCGLLLDVNNIYVSSINHGFNPLDYIEGIPKNGVGQIHLAGHSTSLTPEGKKHLVDTHDHPVCDEVWELYRYTVRRFGKINTMVEWDSKIPAYSVLEAEIDKARQIESQVLGQTNSKRTRRSQVKVHAKRIQSNPPQTTPIEVWSSNHVSRFRTPLDC